MLMSLKLTRHSLSQAIQGHWGGVAPAKSMSLELHVSRCQAAACSSPHQSVCGGGGSEPASHMAPASRSEFVWLQLPGQNQMLCSGLRRLGEEPTW